MSPLRILCCVVLFATASSVCHAEWSSDPAVNLIVSDDSGDQVQPKVAPTADGGCYISWFNAIGNGFDVRVQKLDAAGNEIFAHNGVLVADRGFSSTQDYGLDVDATGNALLAFRDDAGAGIQITAAKVSPTGALVWGASGIQLTNTSDFVASPKIAGTSDGGAVVTWTQDVDARLQKLDAGGAPQWGAGVTLSPAAGSYSPSDLHDAGTDVIVGFVHQIGAFGSPRHLLAQKLDASGALLWGASHVAVFDGGSLQFGNFPEFTPDGSGGAVFSWYDTASLQLQCYAQRVLAGGSEAFSHNGVAVSTNATRVRVSPSVAFDSVSSEMYLFWVEQNSSQSQSGVYGQKLDPAGARQWTDDGAVVVPLGSSSTTLVRAALPGAGSFVFWSSAPAFNQDRLFGARLDTNGATEIGPFDVASTSSGKSRLDVGESTSGFAILAWSDSRSDAGDILAQNVNPDGTLGPATTGVAEPLTTAPIALRTPWPNPLRTATEFEIAAHTGPIDFGIFDALGRQVRTWGQIVAAERTTIAWDGRDDEGVRVGSGVYFARLRAAGATRTTRVTVIR